MCEFSDRCDPKRTKSGRAGSSYHIKVLDRKRPEFFRDLFFPERVDAVWFFKITCHLSEQLIRCDPDVNGKAELLFDSLRNKGGSGNRRFILIGDRCKVQKTFINGKLFNVRCKRTQKRHKLLGILTVHRMIRTCDNQGFAFSKSMCDRFAGFDTKRFCRSRLCQYDPVTALAVSADNGRDRAQIDRASIFQLFNGSPA